MCSVFSAVKEYEIFSVRVLLPNTTKTPPFLGTGAFFFYSFRIGFRTAVIYAKQRYRNMTICARVQSAAEPNIPLPMPAVMPFSHAH